MQVFWLGLGEPSLASWEGRALGAEVEKGPGPADHRDVHEREVAVEGPGPPEPSGPCRRLADAVLGYQVFPPEVMTPVLRRRPLEVGDTVGARYHLAWGVDLFFAARVVDRFERLAGGTWSAGFTYRTLPGHALIGEETFVVEKDVETGRVRVALRSWSRPGSVPARAFAPLVRRLQLRAGRQALDHLARVAGGAGSGTTG